MEWHITDAQSLNLIEQALDAQNLSLAERVLVQRVIYATGDFEYLSLLHFSPGSLSTAAAALAAHTTLIVDGPMVQAGLAPSLQRTFANPMYCAADTLVRPQTQATQIAWGVKTLAQRYRDALFMIGEDQTVLAQLIELIKFEQVQPALVIDVAANFGEREIYRSQLDAAQIPYITCQGRKGGPAVAVAIVQTLIELAWKAYGRAG
jgi:precorrin-8X/cobalt-precorrin-8 methylmutase